MSGGRTLFEKVWDDHVAVALDDGTVLLSIDRHLVNEVTSPQAFAGLRERGIGVLHPELTIAVADHNVPTEGRAEGVAGIDEPRSRAQVEALERNVAEFHVPYVPLRSGEQGIVHVIGPELGLTLPGTTIVCGDSHTSTHGAFGALAFGIGTSEMEHVLATQTLAQRRPRTMLVRVDGELPADCSAKDLILTIIGRIGTAGATGHVIEYAGEAIRALDMAGRMTVCNMSIEAGARAGMIAPDDVAFDWLRGRRFAPAGDLFDAACASWRTLASDEDARFDRTIEIDASTVRPMITWGTSPEEVVPFDGATPVAGDRPMEAAARLEATLGYMGLGQGENLSEVAIDVAFIGSCTNARIEDLRAAAAVVAGRRIAPTVRAMVVPGSGAVKAQAEGEGLDDVFRAAGFEWRDAGCSMCLGMNPDRLMPGQRCASTSNRNFEGRQGPGGRTHLMSPASVAASAIVGRLATVRDID